MRSRTLVATVTLGAGVLSLALPWTRHVRAEQGIGMCASSAAPSLMSLDVDGDQVLIYRDEFGRPHVFADTNRGLFVGAGYAVAQDRLWQLELTRRGARGRLAEILGASVRNADVNARILGYTDNELDAQFALLTPEEQGIFTAYADGINRYVADVIAPAVADKLPYEFQAIGVGLPEPWTVRDSIAIVARQAVNPPQSGQGEVPNATLLSNLTSKYCTAGEVTCPAALGVFNDMRWRNDPDAPVSVPAEGANGARQRPSPPGLAAQLAGASDALSAPLDDEARAIWESLGIPTKLGSFAFAVSAAKSANGSAMLSSGPQIDTAGAIPSNFHELYLIGGDGFHVGGMTVAGIPAIAIGRTDHIAWGLTTANVVDNVDMYKETLCNNGKGYLFKGVCTPYQARSETIQVKGGAPLSITVLRSVHGPVVSPSSTTDVACVTPGAPGLCYARKRAYANHEIDLAGALLAVNRAHNPAEFAAAVDRFPSGFNFVYADQVGNIGFWQAGNVPVRPEGFDPRLPLPGDGSAEWPGGTLPNPSSINPVQGWLANWGGKPTIDWDNPDHRVVGKEHRLLDIEEAIAHRLPSLSLDDMRDIARKDIARTPPPGGGAPGLPDTGRDARYLKPYLLATLDAVPPTNPLAAQAIAILKDWDGSSFTDAVTSTTLEPGYVIFSAWLNGVPGTFAGMLATTFGDDIPGFVTNDTASVNMLIHVLDHALGSGSGVNPSRDYFNGIDPNAVMSKSFDDALDALGTSSSAWSAQPRGTLMFSHTGLPPVAALSIPSIPLSNRGTYAQIVVLSRPAAFSENILPLGQSGFIQRLPSGEFQLDPHFKDQTECYRNFQYKPMPLFRNSQLKQ